MHSLYVKDDLSDVGKAIAWADRLVAHSNLSGELRRDLQVCLEEALANLILHGHADGEKDIRLEVSHDERGVEARLSDCCAPFDVVGVEAPNLDPERIGGAGLRLIRAFASTLRYESRDGRNRLTMRFDAKPSPRVQLLRRIAAFAAMPDAALADLFGPQSQFRYAAGVKLMTQGEDSAFALVLLSGEVSIVNESAHGAFPVARIVAPALLGEIGALAELTRTASVVAAADVEVLRIERAKLREAFCHAPDMLLSVIAQLGQQIRNVNNALGLYASGFAALERGALDDALAHDLSNPSPELQNFSAAFDRLAKRIALERKTRADMASAALIQRQMLPQGVQNLVSAERCDVFGDMKPAKDVGGDLFDIVKLDEDRLAFCIGDVCGKGVPASLFMCVTVTMLRLAAGEDTALADMMQRVNARLFEQNPTSMFSTLFYGVLDLRSGRLDYVNCGHNPPVLINADGACRALPGGGPPLGILPDRRWTSATIELKSGDALFLYTDGVTEAFDPAGAEYGEARLMRKLASFSRYDAQSLVEAVMADVDDFAQGADQADDVTCVAVIRGVDRSA